MTHKFKVGDRVRIIGPIDPKWIDTPTKRAAYLRGLGGRGSCAGKTGTITGIPSEGGACDCSVRVDDHAPEPFYGSYAGQFWQLAPLEEEAFLRFIEQLESLPIEREGNEVLSQ